MRNLRTGEAKLLLADVFEQIGYQQESPSVRNSFLGAALELRSGIPEGVAPQTASPDVLRALTTEMFFDFTAIRLDSTQAEDIAFVANVVHPDTGEELIVELSNAVLTTQVGFQSASPTFTLRVDRRALETVFAGEQTVRGLIESGVAEVDGDASGLTAMFECLVDFELLFEMMPGTK